MSHDQPGPYGQPGPSGQQYGGQSWGLPQQPNPYGRQPPYDGAPGGFGPPPPTPKKKTGLIIIGMVVALAVIAGGAYFALGGEGDGHGPGAGVGASGISGSTKGYKLIAPESVDAYEKSSPGSAPGELNAEQKEGAQVLGVNNARAVSGIYNAPSTDPEDPATVGGRRLIFDGLYGEIADPAMALDHYFTNVDKKGPKGDGKRQGVEMRLVGKARVVKPAGFEGALMKCQDVKVTRAKGDGNAKSVDRDYQIPVCAWSDYSTVAGANVLQLAQPMTGGQGASQDEVAALTAKLYNTARHRV
ncbi:hypothetical protein [Streptomyces sp. NPDC058623]|uniref:hypothetical protein n=1 Tax=Streptomyces sp. NPDC058623 TaxID=3346563 RepID=UPI003648338A